MKIRKELPMFENKSVLFVAAGSHDGILYIAGDGSITKASSFRVKKPKYSDNEGFYTRRSKAGEGKGKQYRGIRSGSVREIDRRDMNREFFQELEKRIKDVASKRDVTDVYFFIPPSLKDEAKRTLPASLRRKLRLTVEGNYHEHHPFELIELADKKRKALPVSVMKPEARSLMNRRAK